MHDRHEGDATGGRRACLEVRDVEREVDGGESLIFERLLPAIPASVGQMRGELGDVLAFYRLAVERRADIALVFSEAATNAVVHAYRDHGPGPLYGAAALSAGSLVVSVVDRGGGMRPRLDSPGAGLGVPLMTRLADDLRISSDGPGAGTCVHATFARVAGGRGGIDTPVAGRRELLREYLRVVRASNAAVRQDTRAVLAQAQQAVMQARRVQRQFTDGARDELRH